MKRGFKCWAPISEMNLFSLVINRKWFRSVRVPTQQFDLAPSRNNAVVQFYTTSRASRRVSLQKIDQPLPHSMRPPKHTGPYYNRHHWKYPERIYPHLAATQHQISSFDILKSFKKGKRSREYAQCPK